MASAVDRHKRPEINFLIHFASLGSIRGQPVFIARLDKQKTWWSALAAICIAVDNMTRAQAPLHHGTDPNLPTNKQTLCKRRVLDRSRPTRRACHICWESRKE